MAIPTLPPALRLRLVQFRSYACGVSLLLQMSLVSTRRDVGEQKPPDAVPCLSRDKKETRLAGVSAFTIASRDRNGISPRSSMRSSRGDFDDGFASVPLRLH